MTETPVLEVRGAVVRYGARRALDGVDVSVARGERIAVLGPSGAGKSTLLGLLNGTLVPAQGTVRVLGHDPAALHGRRGRDVRRQIGTVHQQLHLTPALRAVHNVNAGRLGAWSVWRALRSLAYPGAAPDAMAALARVGLAGRERERTDRLSGGEQQRVAIARLLVQRPVVTLADEPLAGLDPARAQEVLDLLADTASAALVVSLHEVRVALSRFDRVVALREGRLAFDAPPAAVTSDMLARLYALEAA